jgi:hypothetical protein
VSDVHTTETIIIDPTQTTALNLTSLAFAWGYSVDFGWPRNVDTYDVEVTVTGRDAADFVIRFEEEIG